MPRRATRQAANQPAPEPIKFEPDGYVLEQFLTDQSQVAIIQGPIGSGKTRTLIMRMILACQQQPVQRDGKRRSRWLVVRQTYPELKTTTIAAFTELFPDSPKGDGFGYMSWSPPFTYHFRYGDVEADFIFLALEKEDDVKKLRSLEVTGIYFNELQYIPINMFVEGLSRTGRYPSVKDGGCSWAGAIADMNAPEALHWVPIMFGRVPMPDHFTPDQVRQHKRPEKWRMFIQPAALLEVKDQNGDVVDYQVNPQAENLRWLRNAGEYYADKIAGASKPWIDANLLNRPAAIMKGRAVYPLFDQTRHVAKSPLVFNPEIDLYGGFDFGITPAAVFGHYIGGRIYVLMEMYAEDIGSDTFAPLVKSELLRRFPNLDLNRVKLFGDPGGNIRVQTDATTAFQIFHKNGLMIRQAPGANRLAGPMGRKDLIDAVLKRQIDGQQAMVVDPNCRMFIAGMGGGYQFKDVQSGTGIYKTDAILKNQYSHVCFVAGTPVSTPNGPIPIEQIKVGDYVSTPGGKRMVRAAMSRPAHNLVRVDLSNGQSVVCTPEHPFATRRGFIHAEALQYGQLLIGEGEAWADPRYTPSRNSLVSGIIGDLRATTERITSWAGSTCTALCGRITTALSRKAGRSTTSTTIQKTTPSRTLRCTMAESTPSTTTTPAKASSHTPLRNGWTKFATWLRKLGDLSRSAPRCGKPRDVAPSLLVTKLGSAPIAARNIAAGPTQPSAASAACRAKGWRGKHPVSMTSIGPASHAAPGFGPTSTTAPSAALAVVRVESLPPSETPTRVYDLEVDDEHVFYAGGALVSNCEAGQYMVLGMGEGTDLLFGGNRPRPVKTLQVARVFDRGHAPRKISMRR